MICTQQTINLTLLQILWMMRTSFHTGKCHFNFGWFSNVMMISIPHHNYIFLFLCCFWKKSSHMHLFCLVMNKWGECSLFCWEGLGIFVSWFHLSFQTKIFWVPYSHLYFPVKSPVVDTYFWKILNFAIKLQNFDTPYFFRPRKVILFRLGLLLTDPKTKREEDYH